MMIKPSGLFVALLTTMVVTISMVPTSDAFVAPQQTAIRSAAPAFLKKKNDDLSFIESRDMTREEMMDLNKQNEEIMNMELGMMTGFSLVLSIPMLYLCWVAFFSD